MLSIKESMLILLVIATNSYGEAWLYVNPFSLDKLNTGFLEIREENRLVIGDLVYDYKRCDDAAYFCIESEIFSVSIPRVWPMPDSWENRGRQYEVIYRGDVALLGNDNEITTFRSSTNGSLKWTFIYSRTKGLIALLAQDKDSDPAPYGLLANKYGFPINEPTIGVK